MKYAFSLVRFGDQSIEEWAKDHPGTSSIQFTRGGKNYKCYIPVIGYEKDSNEEAREYLHEQVDSFIDACIDAYEEDSRTYLEENIDAKVNNECSSS